MHNRKAWLAGLEPQIREIAEKALAENGEMPSVWYDTINAANRWAWADKTEKIINAFRLPAHLVKPQEAPDEA